MKKLYILPIFTLMTFFTFGQPILTTIMDGSCSNRPRVIEIYANGMVDFNNYSLVTRLNDDAWDNATAQSLSALGVRTDEFVYITRNGTHQGDFEDNFLAISSSSIITLGNANLSGND